MAAVHEGFEQGMTDAAAAGTPIRVGTLLTAMRHAARSREIAELAVRHRDHGVVGFDIAGAEAGYPPSRHLDAFDYLHRENFHVTIHAGEAFGLPSIWEAVQVCGADRLGHGVRIVDDIELLGGRDRFGRPRAQLGRLAAWVRDSRIPLELCPSSNVQTGAAPTVGQHPVTMLKDLRFRVTVNTDNRLMSATSASRELELLAKEAGWTLGGRPLGHDQRPQIGFHPVRRAPRADRGRRQARLRGARSPSLTPARRRQDGDRRCQENDEGHPLAKRRRGASITACHGAVRGGSSSERPRA